MLEVTGVSKRYGSLLAVADVSAAFAPGEIHALLGENGAGKSTLASIAAGFVKPDSGELSLNGHRYQAGAPAECRRLGISMIHQHFMLVPEFTVAENLALSGLDGVGGQLDVAKAAAPALQAGKRIGWDLDAGARVKHLSVGARQRLEILKVLGADANVILLDEPTAVLSQPEVDDLFRVLRELKTQGKALILIAHKLSEVMAIADRVTVLRKGKLVAEAAQGGFDEDRLARWMLGGDLVWATGSQSSSSRKLLDGDSLRVVNLEVQGDRGEPAVRRVSFEAPRGEVLGIGGVDGNGQLELSEALAGVRRLDAGTIDWGEGKHAEVAYIPQDRQRDGLAMEMSISDNFLVTGIHRKDLSVGPFFMPGAILAWVKSLIAKFSVAAPDPRAPAKSLSGGNQQKIVVGRSLDRLPDLLIVSGPSRGLDVKSTAFVHEQIRHARDAGAAIVLFSADLDELATLSDRTYFMSRGELVEAVGAVSVVGGAGS